jgi:hypothetical protein
MLRWSLKIVVIMGGGRAIETGRIIDARTRKGRLARNTVLFNLPDPGTIL